MEDQLLTKLDKARLCKVPATGKNIQNQIVQRYCIYGLLLKSLWLQLHSPQCQLLGSNEGKDMAKRAVLV